MLRFFYGIGIVITCRSSLVAGLDAPRNRRTAVSLLQARHRIGPEFLGDDDAVDSGTSTLENVKSATLPGAAFLLSSRATTAMRASSVPAGTQVPAQVMESNATDDSNRTGGMRILEVEGLAEKDENLLPSERLGNAIEKATRFAQNAKSVIQNYVPDAAKEWISSMTQSSKGNITHEVTELGHGDIIAGSSLGAVSLFKSVQALNSSEAVKLAVASVARANMGKHKEGSNTQTRKDTHSHATEIPFSEDVWHPVALPTIQHQKAQFALTAKTKEERLLDATRLKDIISQASLDDAMSSALEGNRWN